MKTAIQIWTEFKDGTLTTKQAFDAINERLRGASVAEQVKLLKLSEKILDTDMPLQERNSDIEKAFWASTHKETSED